MSRYRYWTIAVLLCVLCGANISFHARDALDLRFQCPSVSVSCPSAGLDYDNALVFQASVSSGDASVLPTYNWTVSAGTILSGQGTSVITVDMSGQRGESLTATVAVGGFPSSCSTTASCSLIPGSLPPPNRKVDAYLSQSESHIQTRLLRFAEALKNEPGSQAYVIAYAGKRSYEGEAAAALDAARKELLQHDIEDGRIVTLNGGYREVFIVELWIVPTGSTAPVIEPTVKPEDAVILKRPAERPRRSTKRAKPQ